MRKKTWIVFLSLILVIGIVRVPVKADAPVRSGEWKGVTWDIDQEGILSIHGSGAIAAWDSGYNSDAPAWSDFTMGIMPIKVTGIKIDEGITQIGSNAFLMSCDTKSLQLPESVTEIGEGAFAYCETIENVTIPKNVQRIAENAFIEAHSLKTVYFESEDTVIDETAFSKECEYDSVNHNTRFVYAQSDEDLSDIDEPEINEPDNNEQETTNTEADDKKPGNVPTNKEESRVDDDVSDGDNGTSSNGDISSNEDASSNGNISSNEDTSSDENSSSDINNQTDYTEDSANSTDDSQFNEAESAGQENSNHIHSYELTLVKAGVGVTGSISRVCSVCGELDSEEIIPAIESIRAEQESFSYDGKTKKPNVIVKDTEGNIISSDNYDLSYKNNKKIGTAEIVVSFKNNYDGVASAEFIIVPKFVKLSRVSAISQGFSASWTKAQGVTGYQLQYSTDKRFSTRASKMFLVENQKITKRNFVKLRASKRYYVRVRTYKTIGHARYYSNWSIAKSVKTKK